MAAEGICTEIALALVTLDDDTVEARKDSDFSLGLGSFFASFAESSPGGDGESGNGTSGEPGSGDNGGECKVNTAFFSVFRRFTAEKSVVTSAAAAGRFS